MKKLFRFWLIAAALLSSIASGRADSKDPLDNTASGATVLVASKAQLQVVGPRNENALDRSDFFSLNLTTGFTYFFSFNGVDYPSDDPPPHPHLSLYAGTPPAGAVFVNIHIFGEGLAYEASTTQKHFLQVVPFLDPPSGPFTYSLAYATIADPADPDDDTEAGATVLNAPTTTTQKDGPHTLSVLVPALVDTADWFEIDLTLDDLVSFDSGTTVLGDPAIDLFDPTGTLVGTNDSSSGFRLIYRVKTTGTHTIRIRAGDKATGVTSNIDYTLGYRLVSSSTGGGGGGPTTDPVIDFTSGPGLTDNSKTIFMGTATTTLPGASIIKVQYRVRFGTQPFGSWKTATGTSIWSFKVSTPNPGAYLVEVRAKDNTGVTGPSAVTAVIRDRPQSNQVPVSLRP